MNILCFLLLLAVMILLLWRRYMKGRHRDMTLALVWFLLTVAALLLSQGIFAGGAVQMLFMFYLLFSGCLRFVFYVRQCPGNTEESNRM